MIRSTESSVLLSFSPEPNHPRAQLIEPTAQEEDRTVVFHEPKSKTKLTRSKSEHLANSPETFQYGHNCPDQKRISPCQCFNNTIRCSIHETSILNKRLQYLAKLNNDKQMHFETLEIHDSRIKKLIDVKFYGLTFTTLKFINCKQLYCVAYDAFKDIDAYVKVFYAKDVGFR